MSLQSREDLIAKLHSKKYRDAFISSRVSNTLALQIRAMRQERGWSQAHLAELLGTSQNAVYRLESPQYGKASITTLKRLASIFDVGLAVWFAPFSKLVDRVTNLETEDILVPSFDDDSGFLKSEVNTAEIRTSITERTVLSSTSKGVEKSSGSKIFGVLSQLQSWQHRLEEHSLVGGSIAPIIRIDDHRKKRLIQSAAHMADQDKQCDAPGALSQAK